jgi:hypothetical protein
LLLEFFDARFPKITTAQQITNRDTQLPNLLLFLSGATLPEITAGSQFPDLASSILVVDHCCTSAPKPALPGPESSMKSNVRKEHRLDSLGLVRLAAAAFALEGSGSAGVATVRGSSADFGLGGLAAARGGG